MKKKILVILVMMAVTNSAKAVEYSITDLGTLGSDPQSKAFGVNDYGEVVGYSGMVQGPEEGRRAFLWDSANGMQNLGTLGGNHSEAYEINNTGQVVGRSTLPSGEGNVRGFLWEGSSMIDMGTLGGGWTEAHGINNSCQVVGYSVLSNSVEAFRWENNSMTTLQSLTGNSHGYAINEEGQIVGYVGSIAFMWEDGTVRSLGTLGGNYSFAWDISNSGWIVGESGVSGSPSHHAFLWIDGVMTDLGGGIAEAINDAGQIVGSFGLWENGAATALNELLQENHGWFHLYGRDISNSGHIVGEGLINGEVHAFLMTPVPEPAKTYYVDAADGSDDNDGLTPETAFATIQTAIDSSFNGYTVIVHAGIYEENINFLGKNIRLTSADPANEEIINSTIIDGNDANSVVIFSGTEGSSCILTGFTITNGTAPYGGGVCGNGTMATIENNTICGNKGQGSGKLGDYGAAGGLLDCDGLIQHNIISGNSAGFGGGLCHCDGTIRYNIISYNGWYAGGGLFDCNGTISNNLLVANGAVYGGALVSCNGSISNCTVIGNWSAHDGSGLDNCNGSISNCIIYQNWPPWMEQIENCSTPIYSCIERWDGGGLGNTNLDPCFIEPGYWDANNLWVDGDYHLLPDSPCIDAGDPNYVAEPNQTDLDGNPRVRGDAIDMGPYETVIHEARLIILPRVLNRKSSKPRIMAWVHLPQGITKDQIDRDEPLILYPSGIEAMRQFVFDNRRRGTVSIFAVFDKAELMDAIPANGRVELQVLGHLRQPGQYFSGSDTIRIIPRRSKPQVRHRRK